MGIATAGNGSRGATGAGRAAGDGIRRGWTFHKELGRSGIGSRWIRLARAGARDLYGSQGLRLDRRQQRIRNTAATRRLGRHAVEVHDGRKVSAVGWAS